MRKYLALGVALALTVGLGACGSDKRHSATSVTVKADKGGTYHLGYLTVNVPAGAVKKDTPLSLSPAAKPVQAPFGAASSQFDLSFDKGVEPTKPLDITVALSKMPPGAYAEHSLLYTRSLDGKTWELVPTSVTGSVLHAQLTHLSPKMLVYPTDQQLLEAAGIKLSSAASTQSCPTSIATKAGKVVITDASKGWDNKKGSPIDACLGMDGNNAKLTVTNNVDFMLDVAMGGQLGLSGDVPSAENHAIERITKKLFPDSRVNAYLPSDDSLNVALPPAKLPATIELQANHDTFLSQAAWTAVKFIVMVGSEKSGDELVKLADDVLGLPDELDCIASALKQVVAKQFNLKDVFDAVSGPCAGKVLAAIQNVLASQSSAIGAFFKGLIIPIQGVIMAGQTLWSAFTGIRLQFVGANGTMRIVVALQTAQSDASWIKPFVGEWHSLRAVLTIRSNAKGHIAWQFPDQSIKTVNAAADVNLIPNGPRAIKVTYRNVTYSYVGGGTPRGKLPVKDGDSFDLTFRDQSLLASPGGDWCSAADPYPFQQMNCMVP